LREVLAAWREITSATEDFLESLTTEDLLRDLPLNGKPTGQSQGSAIRRLTYHYWFHIGEIQAIRQLQGPKRLPVYVGDIEGKAPSPRECLLLPAPVTGQPGVTHRSGGGAEPGGCRRPAAGTAGSWDPSAGLAPPAEPWAPGRRVTWPVPIPRLAGVA